MNVCNIDFRDEQLRILVVKDGAQRRTHVIKEFRVSDGKAAQERLASAVREIGWKRGSVRIILPDTLVKSKILSVPPLGRDDAQKVVKREIAKDLGNQSFVMGIRAIGPDITDKQHILAEYALSSDVFPYLSLLKGCGMKPDLVTTGLEGIAALFARIRPNTEGREAVLEIGRHFIEMMIFDNSRLMNYKKVPMPTAGGSNQSNHDSDHEQLLRIKMYTLVDALYNFIVEAGNSVPDAAPSLIWLSGLTAVEEGVADCISEGLGIKCSLLIPFEDPAAAPSSIYTPLAGLSFIMKADQPVNLIPQMERSWQQRLVQRAILSTAVIGYLIIFAVAYSVLGRAERDLKLLIEKTKTEVTLAGKAQSADVDKALQDLSRTISLNRPLYGIFRDLANLTPSDISFESLELEKAGEGMVIKITAVVRSGDEGISNGSLTKLQNALEGTAHIRIISAPEVAAVSDRTDSKLIIKTAYEVLP